MATKTITITENAYNILANLRKRERESFSEVIVENLGKSRIKLMDYFGILSQEAGEELEKSIEDIRGRHRKARQKRLKEISQEFKK